MSVRLSIVYLVDLRFFRRAECKNIHKLTLEIVHRSFLTTAVPTFVYNSSVNINCTLAYLVFLLFLPSFYSHVIHILPMLSKIAPPLSQYFFHTDLLTLHYRNRSTVRAFSFPCFAGLDVSWIVDAY